MTSWATNPAKFVTEAFRGDIKVEEWQAEALQAIVDNDRIAVRSGHGVGKSAWLSWVILWWLLTRYPAKVACTAPTAHQLQDVLWGEISKWYRQLDPVFQGWLEVKSERVELTGAGAESFAVARTARKENPEAFQGFHSDNMLFIVDEASGVDDIIFEVGQGAMSTPGAKTLMVGNPTRTSGYFYDAFHKLRDRFWTKRVSCDDSTRVAPGYGEDMAKQYGIDSNSYRVRVLGEFPLDEDDAIIPLHLLEAAVERDVHINENLMPVWGLDVARFGSDRSALCKRRGNVVSGPVKWWQGKDTMQTAGLVMDEWHNTPDDEKPSEILVDVIGIGSGVVDRLYELGLPVRGINVAEAASVKDRYMRLRDELWFRVRDWLMARECSMVDDAALISELTSIHYHITSAGKVQAESKDDMKKRGLQSPDLADAFVLTFAGGLDRYYEEEPDRYARSSRRNRQQRSWMTA